MYTETKTNVEQFNNFDLQNIVTPVNVSRLHDLLRKTNYDTNETRFLVNGFTNGFSLGYEGPFNRRDTSRNIPFTMGDKFQLWNHIMKEVKNKRFAGPFDEIPFRDYVQSPVGLVPKAGNKTRLIFHLSYTFQNGGQSINAWTPKDRCTVSYNDLDHAVLNGLFFRNQKNSAQIFLAKVDLMSAFRGLPIFPGHWKLLILKAEDPESGKVKYFVDKCLPFGASISYLHFQRFSNTLKYILEVITGQYHSVTNYLDDFLFIQQRKVDCDRMVRAFLKICEKIKFPVAADKTVWGSKRIVFLGILIDGVSFRLCIPEDKHLLALNLVQGISSKKKATIKELQRLTGTLNFLCRIIHPGRTFTRRMYNKYASTTLKHYHHVKIDQEFHLDCQAWQAFLEHAEARTITWPFIDFDHENSMFHAEWLGFYSDASASGDLGFGCYFDKQWIFTRWEPGFIDEYQPSIEFLELYALCVAVFIWQKKLKNMCIIINCDNEAVVHMINNGGVSKCKHCMRLLRLLVSNNILNNRRIFVRHVKSKNNFLADALSRMKIDLFFSLAPMDVKPVPEEIPIELWPLSKLWQE